MVTSVDTAITYASTHNFFGTGTGQGNVVFVAGATDGYLLVDGNNGGAYVPGPTTSLLSSKASTLQLSSGLATSSNGPHGIVEGRPAMGRPFLCSQPFRDQNSSSSARIAAARRVFGGDERIVN